MFPPRPTAGRRAVLAAAAGAATAIGLGACSNGPLDSGASGSPRPTNSPGGTGGVGTQQPTVLPSGTDSPSPAPPSLEAIDPTSLAQARSLLGELQLAASQVAETLAGYPALTVLSGYRDAIVAQQKRLQALDSSLGSSLPPPATSPALPRPSGNASAAAREVRTVLADRAKARSTRLATLASAPSTAGQVARVMASIAASHAQYATALAVSS